MKRLILLSALVVLLMTSCSPAPLPKSTAPIDTGITANAWVKIPAGSFLKGYHNEPVAIKYDYEMQLTLVTNKEYSAYLNAAVAAAVLMFEVVRQRT